VEGGTGLCFYFLLLKNLVVPEITILVFILLCGDVLSITD